MEISEAVKYIGVDDRDIDLFESQYVVPEGVSYNSYLILDDKIALVEEQSAGPVELAYEEEQREADPTLEDAFKTQLTDAMDKEDSRDNSEILQLYKEGVSEVEIAKKLGRGLGEIKLVLGLFGEEQNE